MNKRKLVRDLIPEIAKTSGSNNVFKRYTTDIEFISGLSDKIVEEVDEVIAELYQNNATTTDLMLLPILEEMGDVLEVLDHCNNIVCLDSTSSMLDIISINPDSLYKKYKNYSNNDFIQALNASKYALKYTFLFEPAEYERVVYGTCSILLGFIVAYGLSLNDLKESQYNKFMARGGFNDRWYLEL